MRSNILKIRSNDEYNYYQCETFYPNSRRLLRDLQAVPQAIRKAYEAALKVKNVEPNAFAVLVGRTLEIMCKCENVQGRVLADKLRNLGDSGRIPQVSYLYVRFLYVS